MKKCSKCGKTKDYSQFCKDQTNSDGLCSACKACRAKYAMDWRSRNREYWKEWNSKNVGYLKRWIENGHAEHSSWGSMRSRCSDVNHIAYSRYGGRGIKICKEWDSFKRFQRDMGKKPTPKHQLDRIDNDGDYTPENCRWATRKENIRNSSIIKLSPEKVRVIRRLHRNGESMVQIANVMAVTKSCITSVLQGRTWSDII